MDSYEKRGDMGPLPVMRATMNHESLSLLFVFSVALVSVGCGPASNAEQTVRTNTIADPLSTLVQTELAFSQASVEQGAGAALAEFAADDGVLFRPELVTAANWFSQDPSTSGVLAWVPVQAAIASSGELGYTTGPYRAGTAEDVTWGHYLRIWKLDQQRQFKVVLDISTEHGTLGSLPEPSSGTVVQDSTWSPDSTIRSDLSDGASDSLEEIDLAFATALEIEGVSHALADFGTQGTRFHRRGSMPLVNHEEIVAAAGATETVTLSRLEGDVSTSGTLGYTYGSAQTGNAQTGNAQTGNAQTGNAQTGNAQTGNAQTGSAQTPEGGVGNYVAVWRRTAGSPWTVVLLVIDAPAT